MAKRCHHCGHKVEDEEKIFCPSCGELMDKKMSDDVNLLNEIDKTIGEYQKAGVKAENYKKQTPAKNTPQPTKRRHDDDDYEYIPRTSKPAKKGISPVLIVVIVVIIIAILLAIFLL